MKGAPERRAREGTMQIQITPASRQHLGTRLVVASVSEEHGHVDA
jgi:hypothetical protein